MLKDVYVVEAIKYSSTKLIVIRINFGTILEVAKLGVLCNCTSNNVIFDLLCFNIKTQKAQRLKLFQYHLKKFCTAKYVKISSPSLHSDNFYQLKRGMKKGRKKSLLTQLGRFL